MYGHKVCGSSKKVTATPKNLEGSPTLLEELINCFYITTFFYNKYTVLCAKCNKES